MRQYPRVRVGALELVLHRLDPLTNPRAEAAGGKELNVDQRAKVSGIDDMQQVRWRMQRGRVCARVSLAQGASSVRRVARSSQYWSGP